MSTNNQYILEYIKYGKLIKVSAIDTKTVKEVCAVFPANTLTKKQMADFTIKKLQYVLKKNSQ